jgi:hypothetical protein
MCECCDEAREAPHQHRMFADGCLYCAARRIQYLKRVLFKTDSPLASRDCNQRCGVALRQAMALGLPEADIRRMEKLPEWQLAPEPEKETRKKR